MSDSPVISKRPVRNVLFVCLGNSCRSQMAEGFARRYGGGVINAASAGLSSTSRIARETAEVMREKGIDISDQFPKDFEPGLADKYDIIVNISGFELPRVSHAVVTEWAILDPNGLSVDVHRAVRDMVEYRVRTLIHDLRHHGTLTRPVSEPAAVGGIRKPSLWQRITGRG